MTPASTTDTKPIEAGAVNAYAGENGTCVTSFRIGGEWLEVRVSNSDAVTLADMLRLLTRTTD